MGSIMSDEYLMIHKLNILPSEYALQVEQMEGRINQYDNLLTLEQVRPTFSLKFEKLMYLMKMIQTTHKSRRL